MLKFQYGAIRADKHRALEEKKLLSMAKFYYEGTAMEDLPEGREKEALRKLQGRYAPLLEEINEDPNGYIELKRSGIAYSHAFGGELLEKIKELQARYNQ